MGWREWKSKQCSTLRKFNLILKQTKTLGGQTKINPGIEWGQGLPDFNTLFTWQTFLLELKAKDSVNNYFLYIKHWKK